MTDIVVFKNAALNDKYVITGKDKPVKMRGYNGLLSSINDSKIIDAMIARGTNLVAVKPAIQPVNNTKSIS